MISVVIPYFNELRCIGEVFERTRRAFLACDVTDYEILVVDNGSRFDEHQGLLELAEKNNGRVLTLSRNFGYQGALWAGLDHAIGDPIVFMDGDGEDPPEVIAEFVNKWREGYDVVYGVRLSRKTSWLKNRCYKLFYFLLERWAKFSIPLDAGDFSLISGRALKALRSFEDRNRMMRILRAWIGFRQIGVPYHRERRIGGHSKFSFLTAFSFAMDGFVSATDVPVRLSIYCALSCFGFGIIGVTYYLFWYFFTQTPIPGFASLNITLLLLFSMLFVCFSVLAQYVLALLDEVRKRPPYLVTNESAASTKNRVLALKDNE